MAKVIAIANQKGGVAKTTTTQNLAVALSQMGKKVLMIDLDSQASLTVAVGLEPLDYSENNIVQVLGDPKKSDDYKPIRECMVKTPDGKAWIVPSIIDLANLEWQIFSRLDRNNILGRAIAPALPDFDYILIDCSPALGIMTINAFSCADGVLVPCTTEYLSYRGLGNLEDSIAEVKELINPKVEIYGVLATKHKRTRKHAQILDLMINNYLVLAVIKEKTEAVSGIYDGKSVVELMPESDITKAYITVAEMIDNNKFVPIESWNWLTPEEQKLEDEEEKAFYDQLGKDEK